MQRKEGKRQVGEVCQTPSLPLSVGSFFSRQEILTCNIGFDGNFIAGDGEEDEKRIYGDRFLLLLLLLAVHTKETHDVFPFLLRPRPYFFIFPRFDISALACAGKRS